jgi:hypothetical protein
VLSSALVIVPCDHPFGTEAPVDHLGRGFFLKSCQIFRASKGTLKPLPCRKAPVMATLPSLFPRGTRSPAPPRAGLLIFMRNPTSLVRVVFAEDRPTPPRPFTGGRSQDMRESARSPGSPRPRGFFFSGNPSLGRGLSSQWTGPLPKGPFTGRPVPEVAYAGEAPAPSGASLVALHGDPLDLKSVPWNRILVRQI